MRKNISYPEARRLCEPKNAAGTASYAQAVTASSASKSTATTKSISTQTALTWEEQNDKFRELYVVTPNSTQTPASTQTPSKQNVQVPPKQNSQVPPKQNAQVPPKQNSTNASKQTPKQRSKSLEKTYKPGPVCSKVNKNTAKLVRKKKDRKQKECKKTESQDTGFDIEISNRYSSLSSDEEGGMDFSLSESSSVVRDQAAEEQPDKKSD